VAATLNIVARELQAKGHVRDTPRRSVALKTVQADGRLDESIVLESAKRTNSKKPLPFGDPVLGCRVESTNG